MDKLLAPVRPAIWTPQDGPQRAAYESLADEVWYGGAGMGGKSDLEIGLALTLHERSLILRPHYDDLEYLEKRGKQILREAGIPFSWNGQDHRLSFERDGNEVEVYYGYLNRPDDWERYQGRPFDLLDFDEVTQMLRAPVRTLGGWNRTTRKKQRVRRVYTFNPPSGSENDDGLWVYDEILPWLAYLFPDEFQHHRPALPGELRWYAPAGTAVLEVDGPEPIEVTVDGKVEVIEPYSRTFIPAKVEDNRYADPREYRRALQSVPEPRRSQILYGNMAVGRRDNEWQLVPTMFLRESQKRWQDLAAVSEGVKLRGLGVDCARGGDDHMTIAPAFENGFVPEIIEIPGRDVPTGAAAADEIERVLTRYCPDEAERFRVPIMIDAAGVGAAVYDEADNRQLRVYPINNSEATSETDRTGILTFANTRAYIGWLLREMLEGGDDQLALPVDQAMEAEIVAQRYRSEDTRMIKLVSKDLIRKKLNRSPDRYDALTLLCLAMRHDY